MPQLYQAIARKIQARNNCWEHRDTHAEWATRHEQDVLALVKDHLPSGSGFDSGTEIDLARSSPERLVFATSFHHMNEHGYYDGWSEHEVIVKPSLTWGFDLRVTGRDRRQIKEFIGESFDHDLRQEVGE